jgi:hypothetical protein
MRRKEGKGYRFSLGGVIKRIELSNDRLVGQKEESSFSTGWRGSLEWRKKESRASVSHQRKVYASLLRGVGQEKNMRLKILALEC